MIKKILNWIIIEYLINGGYKSLDYMDANAKNALKVNTDVLFDILEKNKDCEYGRKYDFANIHSFEDFKKKVPFSNYDTYAPYIERMTEKGERNLISSVAPVRYVMTSGSMGVPKYIPVSQPTINCYKKYAVGRALAIMDRYCKDKTGKGMKRKKIFCALESNDKKMPDGTPLGSISGSTLKQFKDFIPYGMTTPTEVTFHTDDMDMKYCQMRFALAEKNVIAWIVCFMSQVLDYINYFGANWEMLCDDIEKGTINEDIRMPKHVRESLLKIIKPDPERARELRAILKDGLKRDTMKRIWPDLEGIASIGTGGFAANCKKVQQYSEGINIDYFLYCASEGMFGAARHLNKPELNLLPESCFYEFLPAEGDDDPMSTLTLDQLEVGKDYEIIITSYSGFYRYRIDDVITVLGYDHELPIITFAYRKGQMVNIAGEKMTERDLNDAMEEFSKSIGRHVTDFVVYEDDTVIPERYGFIVETDPPLELEKIDEYSEKLEEALCKSSFAYKYVRLEEAMSKCKLEVQQPQTHMFWRELRIAKGATPNQVKTIRLLDNPFKLKFFKELVEK